MGKYFLFAFLLLFLMSWVGCNVFEDIIQDPTSVYQTAQVILTLTAPPSSPISDSTLPSILILTPQAAASVSTPVDEAASPATVDLGIQPAACDRAVPGIPIDVTVPDGTRFKPGEPFTKVWRVHNAGNCAWTKEYAVIWFSGDLMGASREQFLSTEVMPGQTIDLAVDMIAPDQPGTYQGNWKLRNAHGDLFGIGPSGVSPFWVRVEVIAVSTPTPLPEPIETTTPWVFTGGQVTLFLTDGIDLDTGLMNNGKSDDLKFLQGAGGILLLSPQNGASMAVYNRQAPLETDCAAINLSEQGIPVNKLEDGIHLCYRSDRGLPGFIRIDSINLPKNQIFLEYLTWSLP